MQESEEKIELKLKELFEKKKVSFISEILKNNNYMEQNFEFYNNEHKIKVKNKETGEEKEEVKPEWQRIELETILYDKNNYVLVNPSGMGKTSFLNYIYCELLEKAIKSNSNSDYYPVSMTCSEFCKFIEEKKYFISDNICVNEDKLKINEFIKHQYDNLNIFKDDNSNLLLLLDGFDQIANNNFITGLIECKVLKNAKIIVSSRENKATDLTNKGLNKIRLKFPDEKEIIAYLGGEANYAKLKTIIQRNPEFIKTPILLEMLKKICPENSSLIKINSRVDLYENFVNRLIDEEIDKLKDKGIKDYKSSIIKKLEKISFESLCDGQKQVIEPEYITRNFKKTEKEEKFIFKTILNKVSESSNNYTFRHLSFQSYFAARYMYRQDNQIYFKELTKDYKFCYNDAWSEVVKFYILLEKDEAKTTKLVKNILKKDTFVKSKLLFVFELLSEADIKEKEEKKVFKEVFRLLKEKDYLRENVITKLASYKNNKNNKSLVKYIGSLLSDDNSDVRAAAVEVLGEIGTAEHIDLLDPMLSDYVSSVKVAAATALGKIGSVKHINLLYPMLSDYFSNVRIAAATALSKIGILERIQLLESLLSNDDKVVREAVAEVLKEIGTYKLIELLKPLLFDDDQFVIAAAVKALGKMGTVEHIELLKPLLSYEEGYVRRTSVKVLGKMGSVEHIELLKPLLSDEDLYVRAAAVEALGEVGTTEHVELLKPLLSSYDGDVMIAVAETLGKIGSAEHIDLLTPLLSSYDENVRIAAVEAMVKIGPSEYIDLLKFMLSSCDENVRIAAVETLGKNGTDEHIDLLMPLLSDNNWKIKKTVIKVLGIIFILGFILDHIEILKHLFSDDDILLMDAAEMIENSFKKKSEIIKLEQKDSCIKKLFEASILEPNFNGIGIDLKKFITDLFKN